MDLLTAFRREDKAYNEGYRDRGIEERAQRTADVWGAFIAGAVCGFVLAQLARLMFG
jgi:hypothetical protein